MAKQKRAKHAKTFCPIPSSAKDRKLKSSIIAAVMSEQEKIPTGVFLVAIIFTGAIIELFSFRL